MTRSREDLTALLTGLARSGPDLRENDAVAAALAADELYELGRRDLGTELADVLGGLIEAGIVPDDPAVLNAFGPLIPEPDPASYGARLEEAVSTGRHARGNTPPRAPAERITGVREIDPAEAARLLGEFGKRYPELAEFASRHAGPSVSYPDIPGDSATSFDAVLHYPAPDGDRGLPLSDDDSEAQADAAERLAGFGWDVTGTAPGPGEIPDTEAARAVDEFPGLTGNPGISS